MKRNFFLVFLILVALISYSKDYQIRYLTINDGLSQNQVTSIIKDDYGFMWFGTRGGLNRYDGYQFIHFKPGKDKVNSFPNPSIERLYKKSNGDILVGTKSGGFSVYDKSTELFILNGGYQDFKPDRVISFYEDYDKNTWIGTWENGLWMIDHQTDSLTTYFGYQKIYIIAQTPDSTLWFGGTNGLRYKKKGENIKQFQAIPKGKQITNIIYDKERDCLWGVGWGLGLVKINFKDLTLTHYTLFNSKEMNSASYSVMKDTDGSIWVGTWGSGLFRFNVDKESFQPVFLKKDKSTHVNNQSEIILDIYQDNVGEVWVATERGIVRLSPLAAFKSLNNLFSDKINDINIISIFEDSKKNIWIGTYGSGLYLFKNNEINKIELKAGNQLSLVANVIVKDIYEDKQQNIWISLDGGLYHAGKLTNNSLYLEPASKVFKNPEFENVRKINDILEKEDELWLGTQQLGLFYFKKENNVYTLKKQFSKRNENGGIDASRISSFLVDGNNVLWAATYNGMYRYSKNDTTFVSIKKLIANSDVPLCEIVLCCYLDKNKNIWFGTPCSLNKLEPTSDGKYNLISFTREDGLLDDYVNSILDDSEGNLWISTNAGVSRLDINSGEIKNYDNADGLVGINFSESSAFKSESGILYFGGFGNLTYFDPAKIEYSKLNPDIVITDFMILNKPVGISKSGILSKNINQTSKITLGYRESEFSFEFSSLDYKAPQHNQYAYKLEGYNDDFVFINNRRHISFSNLHSGDYTLYIKGTNSNGIWSNKQYKLNIEVKPAPWRTWYAGLALMIVIFSIVFAISMLGISQEKLKSNLRIEKIKREKENELNEYRYRFFTNISHELRTPLTLILSPISELASMDATTLTIDYVQRKIKVIHQNANRLLNIINQLLEFRKIEAGRLVLKAEKTNIQDFILKIIPGFEEISKNQNIDFTTKFEGDDWNCFVDVEKMSMVIYNLLSNAFKYSGKPGKVTLKMSANEEHIGIELTNNGAGIPANEKHHIFERFYQIDNHNKPGSTGIGLSLVKSYVDLHKADILVDSIPGEFTTFKILLKKGDQHILPENIVESGKTDYVFETIQHNFTVTNPKFLKGSKTKAHTILVVEDNEEIRSYLVDLFMSRYDILEAANGKEGIGMVIEYKPSIVISDVMMPLMDGFELCQRIKSNETISHTPVILLTAKGTAQDQLYGAKKGADIYLTKPFDPELLLEKVKTLISNKDKLVKQYAQKVILGPKDLEIDSDEKQFLESVIRCIENHMGDASFDAKMLASELAMSSSTFFRKTKKLTKNSPGELIKNIKIQRAAQLLKDTNLSVSEIAESIGYLDIKNFRTVFKREYKLTPLEYRSSNKSS